MNEVKKPCMGKTKKRSFEIKKALSGQHEAKKRTTSMHYLGVILSQMSIMLGDRLKLDLRM